MQQPAGKSEQPGGNSQQPAGKSQQPGGKPEHPAGKSQQPAGKSQQPAGKSPEEARPNIVAQFPSVSIRVVGVSFEGRQQLLAGIGAGAAILHLFFHKRSSCDLYMFMLLRNCAFPRNNPYTYGSRLHTGILMQEEQLSRLAPPQNLFNSYFLFWHTIVYQVYNNHFSTRVQLNLGQGVLDQPIA